MSRNPTQSNPHAREPGSLDERIIDFRRRRQRRGRTVLAPGTVIAYLPHEDFAVRVSAGDETVPGQETALDVAAALEPLPAAFEDCVALSWQPIGSIAQRWLMPAFTWTDGVTPCFGDADAVAAKGIAAYYHVHKGYLLNAWDGIIANPAPQWIDLEAT